MSVQILHGDCRELLKAMPSGSVHCCVTSPPYFGLRDYQTGTWSGGDDACAHRVGGQVEDGKAPGAITTGQRPGVDASRCKACGAIRTDAQIGLEQTPEAYVEQLVAVFREVRRVLRDDGTLWLNLGDSYANDSKWGGSSGGKHVDALHGDTGIGRSKKTTGLKGKDLIGIPWMVAFALRADGWYLRQDIIWAKPNPMPESVTDRCTKSHEYLFLMAKSSRYYFDQSAIAESLSVASVASVARLAQDVDSQIGSDRVPGKTNGNMKAVGKLSGSYSAESGRNDGNPHPSGGYITEAGTRNKRSVWTVTTKPFSEAHFATFPPDLIEPCILAGCPEGGTVLDPFGGAGTTGLVADRLQRSAVLCELNQTYAEMARSRIHRDAPLFADVKTTAASSPETRSCQQPS